MSARGRKIRGWIIVFVVVAMCGGAAAGVYRLRQAQAAVNLPIAPARKGEFLVIVRCRGDLKAARSVQLYTPMVPNLRIAWMVSGGDRVKEGEPVIKFDSSSAQQELMQKQAALGQAQATLDQAVAQAKITAQQDASDLSAAKYTVELARLEADKQSILSRIEGESKKVDLSVAEQKLKVQEATVDLHASSDRAKILSITRQRDQAQADLDLIKERLSKMELKSPGSGVLVFAMNYAQGWMNAKPFKVGDNVFPGMNLAEIPDLETQLMDGKVEEIDRGRIAVGNEVRIRVDSLPELTIPGKVQQISPLAESGGEFPPVRNFRAYAPIEKPDPRLRPGMNAGMDIIVNRIPNAISIPSKALFTRDGNPIVYLAESGRYRPTPVQVQARNPDEVAVTGIPAGAMVTLVDAEKAEAQK